MYLINMTKTIEQIDNEILVYELLNDYMIQSGIIAEHNDSVQESRHMSPVGIDFLAKKAELWQEMEAIKAHLFNMKRKLEPILYNIFFKVLYEKELEDLNIQYKRFDFYNKKYNLKQDVISYDLGMIKETVLIGDILQTEWRDNTSKRAKCLCPLHQEKTPSFIWYKNTNTWYCFGGCCRGGSVIDLYMAIHKCNFKEAIRDLNNLM